MEENPTRPAMPPKPKRYPMKVVYVYRLPTNFNDATLAEIRQMCEDQNIPFKIREYNSDKYEEDREEIERLPAFHLYVRGHHEKTFYPVGRPQQIILDAHSDLVAADWAARQSRKAWRAWFHAWVAWVSRKRKTRLERTEEAAAAARRPRQRTISVAE